MKIDATVSCSIGCSKPPRGWENRSCDSMYSCSIRTLMECHHEARYGCHSRHQNRTCRYLKRFFLRIVIFSVIFFTVCVYCLSHGRKNIEVEVIRAIQPVWAECDRIIAGDGSQDSLRSLHFSDTKFKPIDSCSQIRQTIQQAEWISTEESKFPLAYAISAYDNSYQLVNFLRLVYRPQNLYCVHVDKKTANQSAERMRRLLQCFPPNVLQIPDPDRINVTWGYYSVLEAFMTCVKLLYRSKKVRWVYLLNANEKELPLRTNWELVQSLKKLNGSNLVYATLENVRDRIPEIQLPFKVNWIKGTFLVALKRDFIRYLLTDYHALSLLKALKSENHLLKIPDEMLFSTLVYNPQLGAPGACDRIIPYNISDPTTWPQARYINWEVKSCSTRHIRNDVCILGRGDLLELMRAPHLFANKFLPQVQPEAYACLSYWLLRKREQEKARGTTDPRFKVSIYQDIYCSKHHI